MGCGEQGPGGDRGSDGARRGVLKAVGADRRAACPEAGRLARGAAGGLCRDLADLSAAAVAGRWRGVLDDPGLEHYTTRELLEQEQRVARWLARAAADAGTIASEEQLGRALACLSTGERSSSVL